MSTTQAPWKKARITFQEWSSGYCETCNDTHDGAGLTVNDKYQDIPSMGSWPECLWTIFEMLGLDHQHLSFETTNEEDERATDFEYRIVLVGPKGPFLRTIYGTGIDEPQMQCIKDILAVFHYHATVEVLEPDIVGDDDIEFDD